MRLLDLPDDVLALLDAGDLTEGHGRALLLAEDHADRRRLAREAVAGEWSVRTLEAKAREAGKPTARGGARATVSRLHPDQEEAAAVISDALSAVLGTEVRVRAGASGYKAELSFADPEEALALARRIGPRRVA
jgi:ParB family chromosome partitioning protein